MEERYRINNVEKYDEIKKINELKDKQILMTIGMVALSIGIVLGKVKYNAIDVGYTLGIGVLAWNSIKNHVKIKVLLDKFEIDRNINKNKEIPKRNNASEYDIPLGRNR